MKLHTSDGKPVRGFSIDGKNETDAAIQKETVVISINGKLQFTYYGWKPFTDANRVSVASMELNSDKCLLFF